MKPWGWLLLTYTAACTGLDVSGREYPCVPDHGPNSDYYFYAPADPQCPAGWRCGLEGFCHARDAGDSYQCVSDLNCELGWRCSSDGTCVDASKDSLPPGGADASYAVKRLNPLWLSDRPEFFAQAETFNTVYLQQLGLYSTTAERSFSFIADGGLLHGFVVQTDAGFWQAYPIEHDRLRLEPYVALAEGPGIAYALGADGTTDVFAYGNGGLTFDWPGFPATALRMEAGSDLFSFTFFPPNGIGSPTTGLLLAYGGNRYAVATGQTTDCDVNGNAQYQAASNGLAPVHTGSPEGCIAAPDGGCEIILDMAVLEPPQQFLWYSLVDVSAFNQALFLPYVFPPYANFQGFDRSLVAATPDGLFIALGYTSCPSGGLFAFDDGTSGAPTPHWQPVDTLDIPNSACPQVMPYTSPQYTVRRIHGLSEQPIDSWLLAEEVPLGTDPADNSNVSISLLGIGNPVIGPVSGTGVNCTSTLYVADQVTCAACPTQSQFLGAQLSFYTVPATTLFPELTADAGVFDFPIAEVRCGLTASDGTPVVDVFQFDFSSAYLTGTPACQPTFVNQRAAGDALDLTLEDRATSGNPSFAGDFGQIWLEEGLMTSASQLTLNAAPSAAFGSGDALKLGFGTGDTWVVDPVLGFSLTPTNQAAVLGSVQNRPEWVVQSNGLVTDTAHLTGRGPAVVAALDPTADPFRPPLSAVLLALPGGQAELVVSSFDVLLGADMTNVVRALSGVDAGTLTGVEITPAAVSARAVPFAKSPIISLVAEASTDPNDGAFGGYALSANGLARFSAVTQQHWNTQAISVPQGNWIAVVDEAGRARIGYGDGSIYSLPSRVMLAPAFQDGTVVSDYASLCGETLALSTKGVFRLVALSSAGGVGSWEPLDLSDAAIRGAPLSGLGGGRLYAPGGELDILGRVGAVSKITCQ